MPKIELTTPNCQKGKQIGIEPQVQVSPAEGKPKSDYSSNAGCQVKTQPDLSAREVRWVSLNTNTVGWQHQIQNVLVVLYILRKGTDSKVCSEDLSIRFGMLKVSMTMHSNWDGS